MISREFFSLADLSVHPGAFDPDTQIERRRFQCDPGENGNPEVAFVVPVHNQGEKIGSNLSSIRANAILTHEFIIVVDGCTDDTLAMVVEWAQGIYAEHPSLTRSITVLNVSEGVFETLADSIGIQCSVAETIIEIQADMNFSHHGFDRLLTEALAGDDRLFLVSGRGTHPFSAGIVRSSFPARLRRKIFDVVESGFTYISERRGSYYPSGLEFRITGKAGRIGNRVEIPQYEITGRKVYLSETVMRGPIVMSRQRYNELGGFDTEHFFLGNDDHDIAMRGWVLKGWRTGYIPIAFTSPLAEGSTRAVRTPSAEKRFAELREHYKKMYPHSFLSEHLTKYPRLRRETVNLDSGTH